MEWALFEILSAWRNLAIVALHMATYLTLPESLSKKTIVSLANVSPNSPPATILHNLHISSPSPPLPLLQQINPDLDAYSICIAVLISIPYHSITGVEKALCVGEGGYVF